MSSTLPKLFLFVRILTAVAARIIRVTPPLFYETAFVSISHPLSLDQLELAENCVPVVVSVYEHHVEVLDVRQDVEAEVLVEDETVYRMCCGPSDPSVAE
jgi:hypothetical protein